MDDCLTRAWWVCGVRGVVALVLGALVLAWPGLTLIGLVGLFAAFALVGGVVSVIGAIRRRNEESDWGLILLIGFVGIGAGLLAVDHPGITALALVFLMGFGAIVTGILDIALAIELRRAIKCEWLLIVSGFVSIAFGTLVILYPTAGALALVWLIGFYLLLASVLFLSFSLRAWKVTRVASARHHPASPRHGLQV